MKMIKTKTDALSFVNAYSEFEMYDFFGGSIWFRYDGTGNYRDYTINHEESGIIGVTKLDVADYVYRNRKKINEWLRDTDARMVKATVK